MARETCKRLSSVWRSPLSFKHRLRLFRATVEPVLLYRCGTWTVNQEMVNKLEGCYKRLLRIVHCVDWTARIRNTYLYGNGLVPPISATIAKRSLEFAEHAFRAKDQPISVGTEPKVGKALLRQDTFPAHRCFKGRAQNPHGRQSSGGPYGARTTGLAADDANNNNIVRVIDFTYGEFS